MTKADREMLTNISKDLGDLKVDVAVVRNDVKHLCEWRDEQKSKQLFKRRFTYTSICTLLLGVFHFSTGGIFK
jgi:hypothetical protein